jgi:hypothetical protein
VTWRVELLTARESADAWASGWRAGETIRTALGGNSSMIDGHDRSVEYDLRYAKTVGALSYRFPDVIARLAKEDPMLCHADTSAVACSFEYR